MPAEIGDKSTSYIILAGLAGALDPSLNIGDVVLDCSVDVRGFSNWRRGKIYTSERIVGTPDEKSRLFRESAGSAVDMETEIVRRMAQRAGIPFISIRTISDTANDTINPDVLHLTDEVGRPRPLAAAGWILRRPGMIAQLARLRANANVALPALGRAVGELLKTL